MKKVRHHYVPRVLLNRFASWSDPGRNKHKVWRYLKDGSCIEVSTKDIAVRKNFYGNNNILEDALNVEEGHLAHVLRCLEDSENPTTFSKYISRFVWLQSFRTLSFRVRLEDMLQKGLAELSRSTDGQGFRVAFRNKAFQKIHQSISRMSLPEYLELSREIRFIGLVDYINKSVEAVIENGVAAAEMQNILSAMLSSGVIEEAGGKSLNSTLAQALVEQDVPAAWRLENWELWKCDSELILGDCCVLAGSCEDDIGPICDASNWDLVIFPAGPRMCLVGYKMIAPRRLSAQEINTASAKSSFFEFYSSDSTEEYNKLAEEIGSNIEIISAHKIAEICRSAWQNE